MCTNHLKHDFILWPLFHLIPGSYQLSYPAPITWQSPKLSISHFRACKTRDRWNPMYAVQPGIKSRVTMLNLGRRIRRFPLIATSPDRLYSIWRKSGVTGNMYNQDQNEELLTVIHRNSNQNNYSILERKPNGFYQNHTSQKRLMHMVTTSIETFTHVHENKLTKRVNES